MPLEITGYRPHSLDPPLSLSSIVIRPNVQSVLALSISLPIPTAALASPPRRRRASSRSHVGFIIQSVADAALSCRARTRNFSLLPRITRQQYDLTLPFLTGEPRERALYYRELPGYYYYCRTTVHTHTHTHAQEALAGLSYLIIFAMGSIFPGTCLSLYKKKSFSCKTLFPAL